MSYYLLLLLVCSQSICICVVNLFGVVAARPLVVGQRAVIRSLAHQSANPFVGADRQ